MLLTIFVVNFLISTNLGSSLDPSKEVRLSEMEGLTGDINDVAENMIDEVNTIVDDQDPGMYYIIMITRKTRFNLLHSSKENFYII